MYGTDKSQQSFFFTLSDEKSELTRIIFKWKMDLATSAPKLLPICAEDYFQGKIHLSTCAEDNIQSIRA